jgi:hypothetical protein
VQEQTAEEVELRHERVAETQGARIGSIVTERRQQCNTNNKSSSDIFLLVEIIIIKEELQKRDISCLRLTSDYSHF